MIDPLMLYATSTPVALADALAAQAAACAQVLAEQAALLAQLRAQVASVPQPTPEAVQAYETWLRQYRKG